MPRCSNSLFYSSTCFFSIEVLIESFLFEAYSSFPFFNKNVLCIGIEILIGKNKYLDISTKYTEVLTYQVDFPKKILGPFESAELQIGFLQ